MILERLIDAMSYGPQSYHAWALHIMQTIFEAPGLNLGRDCQLLADPQLTYPVAALLETERGHQALQVRLQGSLHLQKPMCTSSVIWRLSLRQCVIFLLAGSVAESYGHRAW